MAKKIAGYKEKVIVGGVDISATVESITVLYKVGNLVVTTVTIVEEVRIETGEDGIRTFHVAETAIPAEVLGGFAEGEAGKERKAVVGDRVRVGPLPHRIGATDDTVAELGFVKSMRNSDRHGCLCYVLLDGRTFDLAYAISDLEVIS